ncbi:hypothetical protein B0T19DRAFT_399472 [Cercophora scortea]|uniref:LysM domain-containing protein n=1 Tax=Cercophora scortea TaxID=314031 RepID=A0AAE0IZL8_9PEZI|nr:hypothetical protein B0T19DRAFT_399472 [Cercophora scortea]
MKLHSALGVVPFVALAQGARTFFSALEICPDLCSTLGTNPANWTHYHDFGELTLCDKVSLFDLALHNPVDDPETHLTRACGAPGTQPQDSTAAEVRIVSSTRGSGRSTAGDLASSAEQLVTYIASDSNCAATIMFAQSGDVVLGAYVGSQIDKKSAAAVLTQHSVKRTKAGQMAVQICDDTTSSSQILGVFGHTRGNLAAVQDAVREWSDAKCFSGLDNEEFVPDITVRVLPAMKYIETENLDPTYIPAKRHLDTRATCSTTTVVSGDGCWTVGDQCGITTEKLVEYNGGSDSFCSGLQVGQTANSDGTCKYVQAVSGDYCSLLADKCGITLAQLQARNGGEVSFCSGLQVGQYVCCSTGDLPDFSPRGNSDGSCFEYTIQADDTCESIATANQMEVDVINDVNGQTWGWSGCSDIQPGQVICLSIGDAPMPSYMSNAICG